MDMPQTYHFFDLGTLIGIISVLLAILSAVVFIWFNRDTSADTNTKGPKLYISDNLKMLDQALDNKQGKLTKTEQHTAQKNSAHVSGDQTTD